MAYRHRDERESMAEVLSNVLGGTDTNRRPRRRLSRKKLVVILGIVVALSLLVGGGILYLTNRSSGPFPASITKSLVFPVYYPDSLPAGYSLEKDSVKTNGGLLFFAITSGSQKIFFSEQATPAVAPPLDSIPGFTKVQTAEGTAISGKNGDDPTGLLSTTTTLVNVTGSGGVAMNTLNDVLKSLVDISRK